MGDKRKVIEAEPARSLVERMKSAISLVVWMGPVQMNFVLIFVLPLALLIPFTFPIALLVGIFLSFFAFLTVDYNGAIGKPISKFILQNSVRHFPIKIVSDDLDALDPKRSYVFAGEPHSIFPLGIISLLENSNMFPLKNIRVLVGTTALYTPFVRQIWTWLGCMPASREVFQKLLKQGTSVIIIPGGVQECLYMRHGHEVAFLKKRFGFVRIAIQEGSPLVPVFVFNQTNTYDYVKFGYGEWYNSLSRKIGFAPLWIWGEYFSIIPYRKPLYVAVGKPMEVKKIPNPSREEIGEVHAKFLKAFEELFEKHKEPSGNKDTILELY